MEEPDEEKEQEVVSVPTCNQVSNIYYTDGSVVVVMQTRIFL